MAQQFPDVRFPGWEVIRKLGEGSFGGVYEIHRTLPDGRVEKAALKKLTVPKDNSEIRELYSQSFSKENITAHYKDQMRELVNEYTLIYPDAGAERVPERGCLSRCAVCAAHGRHWMGYLHPHGAAEALEACPERRLSGNGRSEAGS